MTPRTTPHHRSRSAPFRRPSFDPTPHVARQVAIDVVTLMDQQRRETTDRAREMKWVLVGTLAAVLFALYVLLHGTGTAAVLHTSTGTFIQLTPPISDATFIGAAIGLIGLAITVDFFPRALMAALISALCPLAWADALLWEVLVSRQHPYRSVGGMLLVLLLMIAYVRHHRHGAHLLLSPGKTLPLCFIAAAGVTAHGIVVGHWVLTDHARSMYWAGALLGDALVLAVTLVAGVLAVRDRGTSRLHSYLT
jgi:hypothetical protein